MRKLLMVGVLLGASFAAVAQESPDVVSQMKVNLGGASAVEVNLPLVKLGDGQICQAYISQSSRTVVPDAVLGSKITLDIQIGQFCGEAVTVTDAETGKETVRPKGLVSMNWLALKDGLGVHALSTHRD